MGLNIVSSGTLGSGTDSLPNTLENWPSQDNLEAPMPGFPLQTPSSIVATIEGVFSLPLDLGGNNAAQIDQAQS